MHPEVACGLGEYKRRINTERASSNIVCDQTGVLNIFYSSQHCLATQRRVVVKNDTSKHITFLTNNFGLKPDLIADLFRQSWQVEFF